MTPDDRDYQLRMAARRCAFAKACQTAGTINSAIYRGAVDDAAMLAEAYLAGAELRAAAEEAFGALVGAHPADDSVQGKARARLRAALGYGESV